jgi:cell volume regulation protein A
MEPVSQFLVAVSAIFLIGAIGEIVFERTFIPDAIWLILTGVLLGPILGWVTRHQLNTIAPHFAALTLVVVLFDGGSRMRLSDLGRVALLVGWSRTARVARSSSARPPPRRLGNTGIAAATTR